MNIEMANRTFQAHDELQQRVDVLQKAQEINPCFKNPYITGGMLRDILFGEEPRDCDVVFEGIEANQNGINEAIQEAEISLGLKPLPHWEFENTFAHHSHGNIVENTIGLYSIHTDFLTLIMYNGTDKIHIGDEKTLPQIENKIYDPRFQGMLNWVGLRGRTYHEVMAGDALRGLYLTHRLNLTPSKIAQDLFRQFDFHFDQLTPAQQERRRAYWKKKTENLEDTETILKEFGVTAFIR